MSIENRQFSVAPSIIKHLIKSQAGSLGKAILECVQNSIDAGASRVDITLTTDTVRIVDDGHGLRSRDEVLACFEVFGFDHSEHEREFGRFGLGRGQLWAWASTHWRTHAFDLDVDVRERGLDWVLSSDLPDQPGLIIDGRFYTALTQVELVQATNELERLCRYSTVPVYVNDRCISKDPATQKWTEELPEAYLRVGEGNYLEVYNQGIHVTSVYCGQTGVAGVLVTKRGHALTLNIARNDILRAECPLWRKLGPVLRAHADKKTGGATGKRMSHADRDYLAQQTADPANLKAFEQPIFTLANGRNVPLRTLTNAVDRAGTLTAAPSGDRSAEKLTRDRSAVVLAELTLARFGATTVTEFVAIIVARMQAVGDHWAWRLHIQRLTSDKLQVCDDIKDAKGFEQLQANKIPSNELTAAQRRFLASIEPLAAGVAWEMRHGGAGELAVRKLILARAIGAEAYTDGRSYIAITDEVAAAAVSEGLAGFLRITHLLVHEYLHDTGTAGSHAHDQEFYETFHNVVLDRGPQLFALAASAFKAHTKACAKVTRKQAAALDLIDTRARVMATA